MVNQKQFKMNRVTHVEYRGYTTYEIDNLVNSGQAKYLGHGSGRQGAYNWIDNYFDGRGSPGFLNGKYYIKPSDTIREREIIQGEALHAARRAREEIEAQRRAEFDKDR